MASGDKFKLRKRKIVAMSTRLDKQESFTQKQNFSEPRPLTVHFVHRNILKEAFQYFKETHNFFGYEINLELSFFSIFHIPQ